MEIDGGIHGIHGLLAGTTHRHLRFQSSADLLKVNLNSPFRGFMR